MIPALIEKIKKIKDDLIMTLDEYEKAQVIPELERISVSDKGKKSLWCPFANTKYAMPTKGEYKNKYPQGAVVHFTAGRSIKGDSDAISTIAYGEKQGYMYFCISNTGTIYQTAPLNKWGHHAGVSSWEGLGTNLSDKLVGIEICCAGKLEEIEPNKFKSWFGEYYPFNQVRKGKKGVFHAYTLAQEESLLMLLNWLHDNNQEVFKTEFILGHDEIAPTRKNDPGHSLSMTMSELRELVKKS